MKHLSILIPDDQSTLSTIACIVGTYQLFVQANNYRLQQGQAPVFELALVGATKHSFLNHDFLTVKQQFAIGEITRTDLILIPASSIKDYQTASPNNQRLMDWIAKQYHNGAEVASMCIGAFMLAATGLLQGKACSTHWALSDDFRARHPGVNLQSDQLITDENGLYTNGGAYSFLHLLLYLVEKFYDRATAIHCAKYFQIDLDRNQQAEFSIFNGHKKHTDDAVLRAQSHLEQRYTEKVSIASLSASLHIGRRNFDRRFIKATGLTPLDYLQRVRVEAAKKMFETTSKNVNEVMYEVGYSDAKAFREVFGRVTGLSPLGYKGKYHRVP